jgi:hypothetical protein
MDRQTDIHLMTFGQMLGQTNVGSDKCWVRHMLGQTYVRPYKCRGRTNVLFIHRSDKHCIFSLMSDNDDVS